MRVLGYHAAEIELAARLHRLAPGHRKVVFLQLDTPGPTG
jgi:hypothetical protein